MNKINLGFMLFTLVLAGVIITESNASANGIEKLPAKVLDLRNNINSQEPTSQSETADENRLIVPTTSDVDKLVFSLKGCKITHELNDATAIKCPKGVKIEGAREDRLFHTHDLEADVLINADDVWNLAPTGYDGSGVKVAILDSGVQSTHVELITSFNSRKSTRNFFELYDDNDNTGHGTHVAGIITGDGVNNVGGNYATGVAPKANMIVGKVCSYAGYCYESAIISGIEWAVSQKADVLSLSFGRSDITNCDSDPLAAKVNWAVSKGLVVTASSGNDASKVSSPACASKAIAVGATDKSDNLAYFSNYGDELDVVAPGMNILSTYSCTAPVPPEYPEPCSYAWYVSMSGTSMAAPHAAGVVALMLDKNPDLTVEEIKTILYSTAKDLGTPGYDIYTGHGRVDALAAVNAVPETSSSTGKGNGGNPNKGPKK